MNNYSFPLDPKTAFRLVQQLEVMSSKNLSVSFLILFATLASIGFTGCSKEETVAAAPPEVLVIEAPTRDVPVYREWIGTINGSENAEIQARVKGHLVKRNYD